MGIDCAESDALFLNVEPLSDLNTYQENSPLKKIEEQLIIGAFGVEQGAAGLRKSPEVSSRDFW
jgi:hypothetical protein